MSSTNSVRKLQIFYFSKKSKEIKKLKKDEKSVPASPFIHTTNKACFVPNLGIFVFSQNFAIRQI